MTHIEILKNLLVFKGKELQTEPLTGGRTNDNYLVTIGSQKLVARFAPPNTKILGLNRDIEKNNYEIAGENGLGPKVFAELKEHSLLIVEYIEGKIMDDTSAKLDKNIVKVGKLFKKLSAVQKFAGERQPLGIATLYLSETKKQNAWIPENIDWYFDIIQKRLLGIRHPEKITPCHFDIMLENLILEPDGEIKLIDWEYSTNSDWRYDLAMFSSKANLNKEKEKLLLSSYGLSKEEVDITMPEINVMKSVVCLNETMYGVLQNTISKKIGKVDYRAYAEAELLKCKRILESK